MLLGIGIGVGGMSVLCAVFLLMNRGGRQAEQLSPVNATSANQAAASKDAESKDTVTPSMGETIANSNAPVGTENSGASVPAILAGTNSNSVSTVVASKVNTALPTDSQPVADGVNTSAEHVSKQTVDLTMTELVAKIEKSVVRISVKGEEGSSIGSGFVIDTDGSIMTNYHVIEGAKSAQVEFDSGKKFDVVGFISVDVDRDLAIIKIQADADALAKVRIADDLPRKGEKVAAFGAPRGLSFTASDGIISAIRHCPDPEFKARKAGIYLQTTAPISPGNSGGPLVNMRGEVVGMNSFKMQGENLNFAASATDIRDVIGRREKELTPLSPDVLPVKYTDHLARAENLAGTTKGNLLLARIHDIAIMVLPFAYDPTGRISEYVEIQVEKSLVKRAGWTHTKRQSQVNGSTAFVVVFFYFQIAENVEKAQEKLVSELKCQVRIVTRDVDEDGHSHTVIVWDEHGTLGTVAIGALANGVIPDAMKKKISDFFNRISVAHRKAVREAESGK